MPRDLVLGNGQMFVTFDAGLAMRDLYYPYVGLWNHIGGHRSAMGVWTEGQFSWVGDAGWRCELGYQGETLVTRVRLHHEGLGLELHVSDAVHYQENIFLRRLVVHNLRPRMREIRVFFHQDFSIDDTDVGDTAVYDPAAGLLYHYKRDRYFMVDGASAQGGIFQYATGVKRFRGAEGTWRDAEDGRLEGNPIAQGSVDSTISFRLEVPAGGQETLWYWIAIGRTYGQTLRLDQFVRANTAEALINQVRAYWHQWVHKVEADFADLPPEVERLYKLSLPIIRAHVDRTGAITAANDSDILQYNRDHYSYVWPRDGALVSHALVHAGYPEVVAPFFRFCARALTTGGFLLQKYNPDGSAGSCWHPWVQNGRRQLPIQEDETALVLWALWAHYQKTGDIELVVELAQTLITPAAEFLAGYVYPHLGLPRETYDLWEERRGVHTWTASTVVAALEAAANLVVLLGEETKAQRYRQAARRIREGIVAHLYDPALGRFVRGLQVTGDGSAQRDPTPDASIAGLFLFGVLPPDDPRVRATMKALEERLWVRTPVGGVARYAGDYYFRTAFDDFDRVPGNPWFITTLWIADWYAAVATAPAEMARAKELLTWAAQHAMPSGVMPEQLHPYTGGPLSVAPLCWSHAAFCYSVRHYAQRYAALTGRAGGGPAGPQPEPAQVAAGAGQDDGRAEASAAGTPLAWR
jgi:GH15 family glucan-1,4-alpha-glucosidase